MDPDPMRHARSDSMNLTTQTKISVTVTAWLGSSCPSENPLHRDARRNGAGCLAAIHHQLLIASKQLAGGHTFPPTLW